MHYDHVVVTRRGGPEVLEVRSRQQPVPGPGEVLVDVAAAGVSYGDVLLRTGVIPGGPKPPFTPGYDVTGTVLATGPGVRSVTTGERVTALITHGGYTQRIVVPSGRAVPVPVGLAPVRVAATVLNYFVAYQMLHRVAAVQSGQDVLVHGAAGGVGTALLQLAQLAGVRVLATSSAAKREVVTRYGATHLDYRAEDFVAAARALPAGGVHAVFDPVGGTHFRRSYRALLRGGTMVGYGQSQALRDGKAQPLIGAVGFLGGIVAPKLLPDGRSTVFYNAWSLEKSVPSAYREDLDLVLDLLASSKIEPVLARELPLRHAARAHTLLERATLAGKIVLSCHD